MPAARPRLVTAGGFVHAAPEETFEPARLAAIARYRAEASREASRLLRELRLPRAEARSEPGPAAVPDLIPAERLKALRMIASGVLHALADVVRRARAAGRGGLAPAREPAVASDVDAADACG